METTTKVEDVHAQFETLERKIAYAAEYYVNNACDFSDIPSEQIEQMKEMSAASSLRADTRSQLC